MEMHQIRYFLAVAETLNFTRAAEECHVAQPSLSRAIGKLEDELGGALFRRERSRTHLTELGRGMLPLLRRAFDSANTAKAQAASYRTAERAPLRLGLSCTVHLDLIAPALAELKRAFPGLELHLTRNPAADILAALETGDIDLAIAAESRAGWERLDRWRMFEEGFVVLAPQGIGESAADIDPADVIGRPYCESSSEEDPNAPPHRFAVTTDEDAARLACAGVGVAILPESSARLLAGTGRGEAGVDKTRIVQVYGVAGRRRAPAAGAMLDLLRAADWSSVAVG